MTPAESTRKAAHARAKALSPERRKEIASDAAKARWAGLTAEQRRAIRATWKNAKPPKDSK